MFNNAVEKRRFNLCLLAATQMPSYYPTTPVEDDKLNCKAPVFFNAENVSQYKNAEATGPNNKLGKHYFFSFKEKYFKF